MYVYIDKHYLSRFLNSLKFEAMDSFLLTFVVVAIISTSTHVDGKYLDDRIDDVELRSGNKYST